MGQNTRILQKFEYFYEDCACPLCLHWRGRKHGCALPACPYADIKRDALAHGRVKRKPGSMRWS